MKELRILGQVVVGSIFMIITFLLYSLQISFLMCDGVLRCGVDIGIPSWSNSLLPQAMVLPSVSIATVCKPLPTEIAATSFIMCTGVYLFISVPSPGSVMIILGQHYIIHNPYWGMPVYGCTIAYSPWIVPTPCPKCAISI